MERIKASLKAEESIVSYWAIKEGDVLRNLDGKRIATVLRRTRRGGYEVYVVDSRIAGLEPYYMFISTRQIAQKFPIQINN